MHATTVTRLRRPPPAPALRVDDDHDDDEVAPCLVCTRRSPRPLCAACAARIACGSALIAEQVVVTSTQPTDGALVDPWGRTHRLDARVSIGRAGDRQAVHVSHASVSRQHARLWREDRTWRVRDDGSLNGTYVDGALCIGDVIVRPGAVVQFGDVSFFFVIGCDDRDALDDDSPTQPIALPLRYGKAHGTGGPSPDDLASDGLPRVALALVEAPSGGGGYLIVDGVHAQLTHMQLAFMQTLVARTLRDDGANPLVRGFVGFEELMVALPWNSRNPTSNHLRQLIRRVRGSLAEVELGWLVEARRHLGYRLAVIPA